MSHHSGADLDTILLHIGPASQRGADLSALASIALLVRVPSDLPSGLYLPLILVTSLSQRVVQNMHTLSWMPFPILATSVVTSDLSTAQRMEGDCA